MVHRGRRAVPGHLMNDAIESPPPDLFDEDDVSVNVSRVTRLFIIISNDV